MADQDFDRCTNCGALKNDHIPSGMALSCPTSVFSTQPLTEPRLRNLVDTVMRRIKGEPDDMADLLKDDVSSPPRQG